jgi:hypothetical protein
LQRLVIVVHADRGGWAVKKDRGIDRGLVGLVVTGVVVLLIAGLGVLHMGWPKGPSNGPVKCGSHVMSPGDQCGPKSAGSVPGVGRTYEQMRDEQYGPKPTDWSYIAMSMVLFAVAAAVSGGFLWHLREERRWQARRRPGF